MKHSTSFLETFKESWQTDDEVRQDTIVTIVDLAVIVFAFGYWIGQVLI